MAELLVEFFRYYSWRFDLLRHVVSVRTRRIVTKLDKTETHAWFHSDHLRYYMYNLNSVGDRTVPKLPYSSSSSSASRTLSKHTMMSRMLSRGRRWPTFVKNSW